MSSQEVEAGWIPAFLKTATLTGLRLEEAVCSLMQGATGHPLTLGQILGGIPGPSEMLQVACTVARSMEALQSACAALTLQGIHPLSLLLAGDRDFHQWLAEEGKWRFHQPGQFLGANLQRGILTLNRFQATEWLRDLPPHLAILPNPKLDTLMLTDADVTGLLPAGTDFPCHLKFRVCDGTLQLPSRIHGGLQLDFSEAHFQFPRHLDLDGALEIRGCSGVASLSEQLRTRGLYLQHCPSLDTLPRTITGAAQIELINLPIRSFPQGVEGVSYFDVSRAPRLEELHLPSGNPIDIDLKELPNLKRLHLPAAAVIRNLSIRSCPKLESIPGQLKNLTGSLTLKNLPSMSGLPRGLRIAKDLCIRNCPGLGSLEQAEVVAGGESELS
ncbi:hypothetical protein [Holophaga foetida]|uniref:hypothetical protein n=1 Tax=Holophaga foetida TaxID=35839 RepID=UPI0002471745|nr:hypothetical protein [Holophaga foetida]